jgi:hypothetical protein
VQERGRKTEFGVSNYMVRKAKNSKSHMKLKEDTMKFLLQFYDYRYEIRSYIAGKRDFASVKESGKGFIYKSCYFYALSKKHTHY